MSPLPSHQLVDERAARAGRASAAARLADDDLGDVALAGVGQDLLAHPLAAQRDDLGARAARPGAGLGRRARGPRPAGGDAPASRRRRRSTRRRSPLGHAPGRAHQPRRRRARADADQQPLARPASVLGSPARAGSRASARRRARPSAAAPARAGRSGCPCGRSCCDGPLGLLGDVDLALAQPLEQVVGRQVDQLDLVGLLEDRVGHRLADDDAGDLARRRRSGSRGAGR